MKASAEGFKVPNDQLVSLVSRATTILIGMAGGVFSLVMVYGGIRFMLAHSPRSVQGAKEIMGRAALGLLLILLVGALKELLQYLAS
jgi:hypothetical protein